MDFEVLACKRVVKVTKSRIMVDYSCILAEYVVIEIGVLARQCLSQQIISLEEMKRAVTA